MGIFRATEVNLKGLWPTTAVRALHKACRWCSQEVSESAAFCYMLSPPPQDSAMRIFVANLLLRLAIEEHRVVKAPSVAIEEAP